uniref:Uncharacterized protein n=1 Tax=Anopheles coluzzii TaxID=1518534 RepID=A0A8W7P836_ANOCL
MVTGLVGSNVFSTTPPTYLPPDAIRRWPQRIVFRHNFRVDRTLNQEMIAGYRLIVGPLLPLAVVLLLLTYRSVLELSMGPPPPAAPPPPPFIPPPFGREVGTLGCMSDPIAGCMIPSRGLSIVSFTCRPDSLIRFTTSLWLMPVMSIELTAMIRSPIFSSPHRSAGLPGIRSPIDDPRN